MMMTSFVLIEFHGAPCEHGTDFSMNISAHFINNNTILLRFFSASYIASVRQSSSAVYTYEILGFFFILFHENHNHILKSCAAFEIGGLLHLRSANGVAANINLCKINKFKLCQSRTKWHMKSGDTSRQHTIFMPFWINNIYRSSGQKANEKFTRAQTHLKLGKSRHINQLRSVKIDSMNSAAAAAVAVLTHIFIHAFQLLNWIQSPLFLLFPRSLRLCVSKCSFCNVRFMHLFKRHFSF